MKFISKHSNYRVVLRPGIPGNRLTGTPSVPGIYVKFKDGVAEVKDEKIVKMMLEHPAFGTDNTAEFIIAPEDNKDPHELSRKNSEPEHNIVELDHGAIGKLINPKSPINLSNEQKEYIKRLAFEMAEAMYKKKIENDISSEKSLDPVKEKVPEPIEDVPVNKKEEIKKEETEEKVVAEEEKKEEENSANLHKKTRGRPKKH